MNKVLIKILDSLFRLSLGLILLWLLSRYSEINGDLLLSLLSYELILYALILKTAVVLLMSYRWMFVLRNNKINQRLIDSIKFTLIGQSLMAILPGVIAQDITKIIGTIRSTNSSGQRGKIILLSILDRLIGVLALLVSSIFSILIFYLHAYITEGLIMHHEFLNWVLYICSISLFGLIIFYLMLDRLEKIKFSQRIPSSLISKVSVLSDYLRMTRNKFLLLNISIFSHLFNAALVAIIINELSTEIHVLINIMFGLISNFGNFFPLTPGGLGITESVFIYLYTNIGYDLGLLAGLSYRTLSYVSIFILTAIIISSIYVYNSLEEYRESE